MLRRRSAHDAVTRLAAEILARWPTPDPVSGAPTDPEIIHDCRVATRQMRTLLDVFAPWLERRWRQRLRRRLRKFAGALGAARDADVFLTATLPALQLAHSTIDWEATRAAAELRQTEMYGNAAQALFDARHARLVRRIKRAFGIGAKGSPNLRRARALKPGRGASATGPKALARRAVRQLRRHCDSLFPEVGQMATLSPEQLHRLRVRIKAARYATDMLSPWLRKSVCTRYLATLRTAQDLLGEVHDLGVARQHCDTWPVLPSQREVIGHWLDSRMANLTQTAAQAVHQLPSPDALRRAIRQR
ncbi:CHAD domain-containing protein [Pandoraea terrae]|nr:CHAD domain-containing protein [Pandoraea terrae]